MTIGTISRGSNWTGAYSRFSFDLSKRQLVMLKELGKPVLDDEFNFLQDALLTHARLGFHESIGDGSPNNGLMIQATGANNDFTIKGGDGTVNGAGVFYVGGLRMFLPSDTAYSTQESPGAPLAPPGSGTRTDTVYLDIYLDEQSPSDDPTMVDPTLGVETSRRLHMLYQVLVAQGTSPPESEYIDANGRLHLTSVLATLNRTTSPAITSDMIVDRRGKFQVTAQAQALVDTHDADPDAHYPATISQRGFIRIATGAEASAGTDNTIAITPLTLQTTLSGLAGGTVPVGMNAMYEGSSPPAGWLVRDGSAVSRTTYINLFALFGTRYGAGDGTSTFNLPDDRGRTLIGAGTGSGLTARSIGDSGGEETHQLTVPEMPSHTHNIAAHDETSTGADFIDGADASFIANVLTDPTGGDDAHNNMQPWRAKLPIVKF